MVRPDPPGDDSHTIRTGKNAAGETDTRGEAVRLLQRWLSPLIIWLFGEKRLALDYRCIYNYFISRTLKREEPHRSGAPHKERVMMKLIIILIVLLVISSPAY
ncbi:type I toxin-antitoxin system Ibs family toxin [Salmonella enterica subsp. enterica]|nr:type I toxin-antitoxin system Ibs family toxin [Salmonella enterica subsp. enterica serovar Kambole]ECD9549300.1 type I toxin-antitoxin system Ibs family toxin [Salmonella enterica subsp. houtenae]ECG3342219.1 type I toxin-antitoxin system Ibs family toxin [Salmonella enterica subsp. enterica serovar Kambole]ECO3184080.1 type I toxin-antitoxin system Ibs family toxin [Salmonella enterica subsp. enterica serovar Kambole]ECY5576843.1 type I toxin-antitoxin system Ibs family toxin [Salmonella e